MIRLGIRERALAACQAATLAAQIRLPGIGTWLRVPRNGLLFILALAAAIRVAAIIEFPSLYRPDENFQFLEQAHRIAFGYGIVPWEFRDGIRSLLLPTIFAGIFFIADRLGIGPEGYILIAHLLLAALSLAAVASIYKMGRRSSATHAMIVGLVAASWFELVYFSFRPLTEAIATDFLLVALALSSVPEREYSKKCLIGIGFCLAMCLMLRVHLFPGLVIALCWVGRLRFRSRWIWLALGSSIPLCAFGISDWINWGQPFHSYIAALASNVGQDKASSYGVAPVYWYLQDRAGLWAGALPVLLALLALRLRASALWILVAAGIVVGHSLIPHKESCFVFPAFACLVVAAAMGSADLILRWRKHLDTRHHLPLMLGVASFWLSTSASLAFAPGFSDSWFRQRDLLQISFLLSGQPDLCGLMLYDRNWYETGGYAYLHRNVPIYSRLLNRELSVSVEASPADSQDAYNFVVLKRRSLPAFSAPFGIDGCFGDAPDDLCVISRPGNCSPDERLHPLLGQQSLGEWHGIGAH